MSDLEKKYAEKVPAKEVDRNDGRVWYIPHHDVHNIHQPDKVRVVFNCPVRFKGTSLNEQLLQGSDLTNSLFGVLLRPSWRTLKPCTTKSGYMMMIVTCYDTFGGRTEISTKNQKCTA